MAQSLDLVFRFLGVDAGAGPEFDRMAGKASATSAALKTVAFGAATAAAGVAIASVKMAGDFQTQMERIHTQANQSNKTVAALSKGILAMSASVASTPQTLAEAAYHIASIGQHSLTTAQQLRVLKTATEGAKIGGANLVDVTNALDAAIVSHIHGVKNYSQAMGVLNATVGAGDMQMQDLAEAFGPLGAVLKGYNVTIQQAGAALATFGDNNLRGAQAGTALRMAVQSLAVPTANGSAQLQAWGIHAGNLSKQLEHGGLTSALDTLMRKMRENGVTAKDQGNILTETFGKRAGIGLAVLMGQLDRYHGKLKEVTDGGNGFAKSWQGYTKTFGYALDSAKASAETLLVQLGTKLLPTVTKFTNWLAQVAIPDLSKFAGWLKQNAAWTKPLAEGIGLVGAALMVYFGRPAVIIAGIAAIAVGLVELYKHSETLRSGINALRPAATSVFATIKAAVHDFVVVATALWHTFGHTVVTYVRSTMKDLGMIFRGDLKVIQGVFEVFDGILTGKWSKVWQGIKDIFSGTWQSILGQAHMVLDTLHAAFSGALDGIKAVWSRVWTGIEQAFGHVAGTIIEGFKYLIDGALSFMGTMIHAASKAFGWVPGLGGKLKSASKSFDAFRSSTVNSLQSLADKAFGLGEKTANDYGRGLTVALQNAMGPVGSAANSLAAHIDKNARQALGISSPSKHAIKTGGWYAQGLAIGMNQKGNEVYLSAKQVAHQLALGLTEGFTGESVKVKDSFSQTMQSVLSRVSAQIQSALTKQRDLLKTYRQQLHSDVQARRSAISSLRDSIAGNADISNVLGLSKTVTSTGLDFTGSASTATTTSRTVNYTGNIRGYLSGQASLLRREAGLFARLRKMGLSPALLAQISGMAPNDAITIMSQILSGQDGSIHSLNTYEAQIRAYAKQVATGTVNTPHELQLLKGDRAQIHDQTRLLHKIEEHLQHFRDNPTQPAQIHLALHELGFTDAEIKRIMARINKITRESGGRVKIG